MQHQSWCLKSQELLNCKVNMLTSLVQASSKVRDSIERVLALAHKEPLY